MLFRSESIEKGHSAVSVVRRLRGKKGGRNEGGNLDRRGVEEGWVSYVEVL
jgi:hypothetical protein